MLETEGETAAVRVETILNHLQPWLASGTVSFVQQRINGFVNPTKNVKENQLWAQERVLMITED